MMMRLVSAAVVLFCWVFCFAGCESADQSSASPPKAAVKAVAISRSAEPADNSRCHVCHINYYDEKIATIHMKKGISCESCHGKSDAHCGDENNITAPDRMFPAEAVNPTCMQCHTADKIPSGKHKAFFAGKLPDKKVCTDCHGKHKLPFRNRKWDKTTGKLL
jgi:hypothetical protein